MEEKHLDDKDASRGLLLYIHKSLTYKRVNISLGNGPEPKEFLSCEIKLSDDSNLLLGLFYRSPNSTENNTTQLNAVMRKLIDGVYSSILFLGDFNYPEIDWSQYASSSTEGNCFIECTNVINHINRTSTV